MYLLALREPLRHQMASFSRNPPKIVIQQTSSAPDYTCNLGVRHVYKLSNTTTVRKIIYQWVLHAPSLSLFLFIMHSCCSIVVNDYSAKSC